MSQKDRNCPFADWFPPKAYTKEGAWKAQAPPSACVESTPAASQVLQEQNPGSATEQQESQPLRVEKQTFQAVANIALDF